MELLQGLDGLAYVNHPKLARDEWYECWVTVSINECIDVSVELCFHVQMISLVPESNEKSS